MDLKAIEEALYKEYFKEDYDEDEDYDYSSEMWGEFEYSFKKPVQVPGLGVVQCVEDFGGEGMGDNIYVVFTIAFDADVFPDSPPVTRYYMKTGYYSSYDGSNWSDGYFKQVEPYEKTVIDYRDVK